MADNVAITAGSGTTVAADEVVDGTLGTVKMQYVKIADGTLDSTTKMTIKAGSTGAASASDTATVVTLRDGNTNGQKTMANSAPVVVASDQAAVPVAPGVVSALNGSTPSRVNAAGSTNATSLKASSGQLYTIDVYNNAAYAVYLKLYNKASAPTVGTDTPVMTIPVSSGGGYSKTWPMGFPFSTGIAYAITKLQADSDTTAVLAGDLTGNAIWI